MKLLLLLILGLSLFLYIPLNRQTPRFRLRLSLDDYLGLHPWTVWLYTSYYLFFPISILLLWRTPLINPLLITQIVATVCSSLIWKIFPNGVTRPSISPVNLNTRFLNLIYHHDKDCNGLPSGHVLHTFISGYFLAAAFPQFSLLFVVITALISFSTITTKQHYVVDMVSTLIIAPIFIEFTHYLYSRNILQLFMYIIRS